MTIFKLGQTIDDAIELATDESILESEPSFQLEREVSKEWFMREVLPQGLDYLLNHQDSDKIRIVTHPVETSTCYEKADLIEFKPEQVIKSLYYVKDGELALGLVVPELGKKFDAKDLARVLETTRGQAKKYTNAFCPDDMSRGTCTPFIQEKHLREGFKLIFDEDSLESLADTYVDFSIGILCGDDARERLSRKVSIQMPYGVAYRILKERFPEYVYARKVYE